LLFRFLQRFKSIWKIHNKWLISGCISLIALIKDGSESVNMTLGLIPVSSNNVIKIHRKLSSVSSSIIAEATILVLKWLSIITMTHSIIWNQFVFDVVSRITTS